jgi:hypothetical protein
MKEAKRGICRVCINTDGSNCKIKKVKTAQNKKRTCNFFEHDISKVKVKQVLQSEYVPYHMTSRKLYKKWATEQKEKELKESMEDKVSALSDPDILSRFRSSAS